jgi:hypothetical protein
MAIFDNSIPLESQIRNPAPPLKRLQENPSRLEVPASERRRALLILHTLIRSAEAQGWTVSEPDDVRSRYRNSNPRDLVAVDAGHCPCMIRIRMKQVRVPHEKTEYEQRYVWARKWDYAQTDILRLEVRDDYDVTYFDDGVRRKVEEQIHRALKRIQAFSDREHERELKRIEDRRIATELRVEQEKLIQKIRHYDAWAESVDELIDEWRRHRQRRETLKSIREENRGVRNEAVDTLLTWADERIAEANPVSTFRLPTEELPDLGHDERRRYVLRP